MDMVMEAIWLGLQTPPALNLPHDEAPPTLTLPHEGGGKRLRGLLSSIHPLKGREQPAAGDKVTGDGAQQRLAFSPRKSPIGSPDGKIDVDGS